VLAFAYCVRNGLSPTAGSIMHSGGCAPADEGINFLQVKRCEISGAPAVPRQSKNSDTATKYAYNEIPSNGQRTKLKTAKC
jgi:hypothetical protein